MYKHYHKMGYYSDHTKLAIENVLNVSLFNSKMNKELRFEIVFIWKMKFY
ncbi:MAG: hypothetical protein K0R92_2339 [Lachnospiraceae bacterium]|nr:hypothetical protein [Lachnospiraceae bacterium]